MAVAPVPLSPRPLVPLSSCSAFSLVELLVTIAIIALLGALLLPAINRGLSSGRTAQCSSAIRQLQLANQLYADDHETYVPAAADIWKGNLQRWHGTRSSRTRPFEGAAGPLARYLGAEAAIRRCSEFARPTQDFEAGCGGYGYNNRGVGSQAYLLGEKKGAAIGMKPSRIADPDGTVAFTDTAYLRGNGGQAEYIEYSFAEAYYFLSDDSSEETYTANPSIHFRHAGRAVVAWCDGHVSAEKRQTTYGEPYDRHNLGWFGGPNNFYFDVN